jgi:hypothetical protein
MTAVGPTESMGCSPRPSRPTTLPAERRRAPQGNKFVPGNTAGISYEDKDGHWHDEVSAVDDRPEIDVEGYSL